MSNNIELFDSFFDKKHGKVCQKGRFFLTHFFDEKQGILIYYNCYLYNNSKTVVK